MIAITVPHSIVSTNAMLILMVLMLMGSIAAALFIRPAEFQRSRLNIFVTILASITVVLIGLSLVVSSVTLEDQEEINKATITKEAIDKLWLYPNKLLIRSRHARDSFLKSLYANNLALQRVAARNEEETARAILDEQNIAIVFIQAWEDYLTLRRLDVTGDAVWINNFIQWAQSPYIKKYFDFLKYNYKDTTIAFAEVLFEYAAKLPIPTPDPELYRTIVQEILQDPRMLVIFEKTAL